MKKVTVICLFIALSTTIFAQKKFGHVDSNAIFDVMPEKEETEKTLKTYGKALEDQMLELKKDFESKYAAYQANSALWSDAIKDMKEEEIYTLQQRIQAFQQKAQEDMMNKETALLEPIYNKIKNAIKEIGAEKSLMYVFEVNSLLYISPESVDITQDVKTKLGIK